MTRRESDAMTSTITRGVVAASLMFVGLAGCAPVEDTGEESGDGLASSEMGIVGWHPPDSARWERVFEDEFEGNALSEGWVVGGSSTSPKSECISVSNNRAHVHPSTRDRCNYVYNKPYGEGDDFGRTFYFASSLRLSATRDHYDSFWVKSSGLAVLEAGKINELDIVEAYGPTDGRHDCDDLLKNAPLVSIARSSRQWMGIQNVFYSGYGSEGDDSNTGHRYCFTRAQVDRLDPYDGHFHVFAAEWAPHDHVTFTMDGVVTTSFGPRFASAQAVQVALTNFWGGQMKPAGRHATDADDMDVEWIRVWRKRKKSG